MFKNLFAASPIVDRLRLTASTDDSEDDATGAGSDLSEDDEKEGEKDELEREGDDQKEEGKDDETVEEKLARLEKENQNLQKRFSDTKNDRDVVARERNLLRQELEQFRADLDELKTSKNSDEISDEEVDRVAGDLLKRVASLKDDDPERAAKIYREIGREFVKVKRQTIAEIRAEQKKQSQQDSTIEQARAEAIENAKVALEELDLDPEKHLPLFQKTVDELAQNNSRWFKTIPASEQYIRIAEKVKKKVESSRQANADHRKDADGMIGSGSKVKQKKTNQREEEGDEPDTMAGAMGMVRKDRLSAGSRMHKLAQQR